MPRMLARDSGNTPQRLLRCNRQAIPHRGTPCSNVPLSTHIRHGGEFETWHRGEEDARILPIVQLLPVAPRRNSSLIQHVIFALTHGPGLLSISTTSLTLTFRGEPPSRALQSVVFIPLHL